MSSLEKVKKQYVKDADAMATKSRFGFFSILPSHTAAISAFPQKTIPRNEDGRVATQPRNIYSGCTSSGQIKKSYFSYTASAFHGSPFEIEAQERLKAASGTKLKEGQEIFKPAKLNKTLMSASYKYIAQKPHERTNLRDVEGRVITANRNIYTSLQSKIHSEANKQFKYVAETCQEKKSKAPAKQSSDQPFKIGNHPKEFFSNNIELFCNLQAAKKTTDEPKKVPLIHDSPFRPSCTATNKFFNPLDYKQQQQNARNAVVKHVKTQNVEHMKLGRMEYNSRPCPSVAYSKMNVLRRCR